MQAIAVEIVNELKPLVGLKLSIARRAANMRIFHFGEVRTFKNGTVGDYALHVQCPWRVEGPDGIVTGSDDLWEPAEISEGFDRDSWDNETGENLQDRKIGDLLGGYDPSTRSFVNPTDRLIVETLDADGGGGVTVVLSGNFRLLVFPDGTRHESWRLLQPATDKPHFVVFANRVEGR